MNLLKDIELVEQLDQLIRLKATGTPDELGRRIKKSRRQVYRIIEDMKALGFPIAYSRCQETFYYEKDVKFIFKVCTVEEEKIRATMGGKNFRKIFDFFPSVPFFGTERGFLCDR